MISPKVRLWLTRLYPRGWRERYGDEFDALLEQCLHSPLDIVDVFLGALDAHFQLINGENISWRMMNMVNKLRTTILIVFASFIGFVIAGFGLVGMADDSPMIPLMKTNTALALSWTTLQVGAVVAFFAVVIGGLPLAITVLRQTYKTKNSRLGLLWVPVAAFVVLLAYVGLLVLVATGQISLPGVVLTAPAGAVPAGNRLLLQGLALVLVVGAAASTWAVWKAISGTSTEQETFHPAGRTITVKLYEFAFMPAVITTLAMLVMLVATAVWGWAASFAVPQLFSVNFGLWQVSTQVWYFGVLALMLLCTLAAFLGLARSRNAKSAV